MELGPKYSAAKQDEKPHRKKTRRNFEDKNIEENVPHRSLIRLWKYARSARKRKAAGESEKGSRHRTPEGEGNKRSWRNFSKRSRVMGVRKESHAA